MTQPSANKFKKPFIDAISTYKERSGQLSEAKTKEVQDLNTIITHANDKTLLLCNLSYYYERLGSLSAVYQQSAMTANHLSGCNIGGSALRGNIESTLTEALPRLTPQQHQKYDSIMAFLRQNSPEGTLVLKTIPDNKGGFDLTCATLDAPTETTSMVWRGGTAVSTASA
jgi:hypothetical protein